MEKEKIEKYGNRVVTGKIICSDKGTFMAYWAAEQWIRENGYSCGSMCSPMPTAIMKGDVHVAKWKNLTTKERNTVDGVIVGEYREGPVTIYLF